MWINQKYTMPKDRLLLQHLGHVALVVGSIHGLLPVGISHSSRCSKKSFLGLCYKNRKIAIMIRHKKDGNWLKRRISTHEILNTLAHELSHLKYFDHSAKFWAYSRKINKEVKLWNKLLCFPKDITKKITRKEIKGYLKKEVKIHGIKF